METFEKLHLANNLDALDLLAKPHDVLNKVKTFDKICGFLDKLAKEAQHNPLDQERTYVHLVRFLYLYNKLLAAEKEDQKFVELRFGNDYKRVKVQFEEVRKSLANRYADKSKADVPEKPAPEPQPSVSAPARIFNGEFVHCSDLYSALQKSYNIMLVDARPEKDFEQSRIDKPNCINVPEHCITAGLSANTLGQKLSPETQKVWEKRDSYDVLVLFDWNSTSDNFVATKLDKLRSALVDWDLNRKYNEKPVILNGGYLQVLHMYPTLCLNPQVFLSKQNNELDELLDIDNIEYPTESDNKAHVMGLSNTICNKTSTEDGELPSRDSLVRENRELSINVQEITSKLLQAEEKWKQINEKCNQETNINNIADLKTEGNQVQDEISQLEKQLDECNEKKEDVKEIFDLYAGFDPENEALKSDELNEIIEIEADDLEKMKVRGVMSEERRKAFEQARASKPKLDDNSNEARSQQDNRSTEVARPVINRATKPKRESQLFRSLVGPLEHITPGRVGLRNIRNTCYMNTVVQCLRNIPEIMHLFCNGTYATKYEIRAPAAIIYETAFLIRYLWSKVVKYIEPVEFYQKVCTLEPSYGLGNHEDCMEFFLFLLNHLSEDCYYDRERPTVMTPKQKAWYNQFQGKNSVFIDLFYHQIRIQQYCKKCTQSTYKFEIESTFMLSVPDRDFTLEKLMADYMADFVIPEYCCSKCKKPVTNKKQICYEPKIVVIVLKRYRQVVSNGVVTIKKIESRGDFPKNRFRLGNCYYQLNSIVMHSGDMNYGHYTAASLTNKGWFEFNDETVRAININDDSVKSKACAFFYSMCDEVKKMEM